MLGSVNSEYLDKRNISNVVMTDRGFTINVKLGTRWTLLDMPSFTLENSQLPLHM